jgi:hypothetical protein
LLGERFTRRTGLWINLGDIMFVAAAPIAGPAARTAVSP